MDGPQVLSSAIMAEPLDLTKLNAVADDKIRDILKAASSWAAEAPAALTPAIRAVCVRLAEMVVGYLLVGGVGLYLEQRNGQIARQGWEFYAITATLFTTFAFPGFTYRYLLKHRS